MADIDLNVDNLISRLLEGIFLLLMLIRVCLYKVDRECVDLKLQLCFRLVRGTRPGKIVQLTEAEVRGLCLKSREIFLQQPILLELEAPLKICGKFVLKCI